MALLGAIADKLPIFQDITRDTRMFTLRLLGRDTNPISALSTSLLLSLGAGTSIIITNKYVSLTTITKGSQKKHSLEDLFLMLLMEQ